MEQRAASSGTVDERGECAHSKFLAPVNCHIFILYSYLSSDTFQCFSTRDNSSYPTYNTKGFLSEKVDVDPILKAYLKLLSMDPMTSEDIYTLFQ